MLGYDLGKAGWDLYQVIKTGSSDIAKAIATVIPGAGLTDSDVAEAIVNGVKAGVEFVSLGAAIGDLVRAAVDYAAFEIVYNEWYSDVTGAIGVTYASGAGDYAEWIEKENHRMDFLPGEVVGVRAGFVSYDTQNSDHNLVISTKPMMLGNEVQGDMSDYEKVAFMGQVPIRVQGVVNQGDHILPTGDKNGYAKAVAREEILFEEIPNIVGVAWEDGLDSYFNVVNCSVGLDRQGSAQLVDIVEAELEEIRQSISNEIALSLVENGFVSPRRVKRAKKRNDKRPTKKPMLIEKPAFNGNANEYLAETIDIPMISTDQTGASLDLPTAVEMESYITSQLQDLREELLQLMHAKPEINAQTIAFQAQAITDEFEAAISSQNGTDSGLPLNPAYSEARDIVRPYVERVTASITKDVVSYDNFESVVREQILKVGKNGNTALLKAYPPGSNAERQLTEKIVDDVMNEIKRIDPNVGKYLSRN